MRNFENNFKKVLDNLRNMVYYVITETKFRKSQSKYLIYEWRIFTMGDFISAIVLLPALCLSFYAAERIINYFVEKSKRKERMRMIRMRRRELAYELSKCA